MVLLIAIIQLYPLTIMESNSSTMLHLQFEAREELAD